MIAGAGVLLMIVAGCLALPESSNATVRSIIKRDADDGNEKCLQTIISNNGDTTKFSFEMNHPAAKVTRCQSEYGERESWFIEPLAADDDVQPLNINTGGKWFNEGKALAKVIKQFERRMDLLVEAVTEKLEERIEEIVPAKKKQPETRVVSGGYKPIWNLSNKYKMHSVGMTWSEAKITCEEEGGHLLVINSPEERNVVPTLFSQSPGIRCANWVNWAWIGVHDSYGEKDFWTVEGERLSNIGYANWFHGRPVYNPSENCVSVDKTGAMYDSRCEATAPFICERL